MKRLLIVILTFSMLFSLIACDKGANDGGAGVTPEIQVMAWTTHATDRQIANVKPNVENPSTTYDVYMAKGETEGCQLIIYSNTAFRKAALTYNAKAHESDNLTMQAYIMNKTHTIKKKEYTDSTIPYYQNRTMIDANKIVPFIVEFTTNADTPAGTYTYTYEFKDLNTKTVYATFTVNVHVWDIVLPENKTFATSVGINGYHIARFDKAEGSYKKYYDLLLEHNVCGHTLPYDILSEEAEVYMDDPRVTSFVIGLWEAKGWSDAKLVQYYNRVCEKDIWKKKALFYVVDEPTIENGAIEDYKAFCERVERLCPGIPVIAPFYTNEQQPGLNKDQVDLMAPPTVLWCPKLCLWDESQSYDPFLDYDPDKTFDERMKEFQADGDIVWSYVCNDPIDPYAQLFIDTDGVVQRLMMWQHYQRDIEGFLYWGTTAWGYREEGSDMNPWDKAYNGVNDGDGRAVYGEGYLLYPGTPVGVSGAVPSLRLKALRDGIDDIEMFYLAEQYLTKAEIMEIVNEATPSLTEYTSEENFYKLRKEFGDALEAAIKAKGVQ